MEQAVVITLFLTVKADSDASQITNYSEIYAFAVANQGDNILVDFDSDPDKVDLNDPGASLENGTDNEINDSGTDLDGDGCIVEDDHDPERISIYDVALSKELLTPEPIGGYNYGDVLTFEFTVCNQGNEDLTQVTVQDYLPLGYTFIPGNGWSATATYTTGLIAPDACIQFTLPLTLAKTNGGEEDWINYAEVISYVDENGLTRTSDADSQHGSNTVYENAVQPGDACDNQLTGCGEAVGEDEDDHDVAGI